MTVDTRGMVDQEHGMVDRRIFSDEEVYQQELEQIFTRAWLFIGHDSLVPNPNDFFTTYMGEDPVILTRDAKGELHAMLNMCRHRGNRVVRADDGNAKNFMCTYHGWTYSSDGGKLVSVPGLQEAYYGELDVEHLGLIEVAQLDTYAGMIFATWDPEAPSLEEYLGDSRWYLDSYLNRRDNGLELIGPDKWIVPSNWKLPSDNFSGDNYHVTISHRASTIAMARSRKIPDRIGGTAGRGPGYMVGVDVGHGISMMGSESRDDNSALLQRISRHPRIAEYHREVTPEVERRLGELRAKWLVLGVSNTFPNFTCHIFNNLVRVWNPRGPFNTEVWAFVVLDKDMPEDVKDEVRRESQRTFNISGMFEQDDMDNWSQSTKAGKSPTARKFAQHIAMGLGHETTVEGIPGTVENGTLSELTQRTLYAGWQTFMDAKSWKEIKLPTRTAAYEGTATFKG